VNAFHAKILEFNINPYSLFQKLLKSEVYFLLPVCNKIFTCEYKFFVSACHSQELICGVEEGSIDGFSIILPKFGAKKH
jgi:hypothetical protein